MPSAVTDYLCYNGLELLYIIPTDWSATSTESAGFLPAHLEISGLSSGLIMKRGWIRWSTVSETDFSRESGHTRSRQDRSQAQSKKLACFYCTKSWSFHLHLWHPHGFFPQISSDKWRCQTSRCLQATGVCYSQYRHCLISWAFQSNNSCPKPLVKAKCCMSEKMFLFA